VPPVNTTPAQTAPDRVIGTPPPEPAKVTPSAPPPSPAKAAPPKTAQPPAAPNEFERQTALAQERRARIERAEKRVAAARSSGSYAGLQGVCERWTEDSPGSAEAWRCLGLARYQAGAARDALPALRQSLKLEPNDSEVEGAILRILRP
jgi:tetratricopeptide (TPR) repeat protein